jgi:UDP:flavonoid glycosyltransferase YjiC (YdhE family)
MKVLFVGWAWPSHCYPLVPLAWAFAAAGHDTRFATQPALCAELAGAGVTAVPVGRDLDIAPIARPHYQWIAAQQTPVTWSRLRSRGADTLGLYALLARSMVRELLAYCRSWRPEILVYETTTFAGPMVAAKLGIPAVKHLWGVDCTALTREFEAEAMRPVAERLGVAEVNYDGEVIVDPCPPRLQGNTTGNRLLMRSVPYTGPTIVPEWLAAPAGRRRICVLGSTAAARLGGATVSVAAAIARGLAQLDAEIIVALPAAERELVPDPPANLRIVDWIPAQLAFSQCDLVVHNGGTGALHTAVAAGVPQLVAPLLPDQIFSAERVVATGAGLLLHPRHDPPRRLLDCARALLDDPRFRRAARRLRAENDALPTPADVVRTLTGPRLDRTATA